MRRLIRAGYYIGVGKRQVAFWIVGYPWDNAHGLDRLSVYDETGSEGETDGCCFVP